MTVQPIITLGDPRLRLKGEPPLTRFALWAASQECTLDDSKARAELGYRPVISRDEGLAAMAAS